MDAATCITDVQWTHYAEGRLGSEELKALHLHVQQCVICADIKDGIDVMVHKASLGAHVQKINEVVTRSAQHRMVALPLWTKVAAVMLVATLVGILVMQYRQISTGVAIKQTSPVLGVDSGGVKLTVPEGENNHIALAAPSTPPQKKRRGNAATRKLGVHESKPAALKNDSRNDLDVVDKPALNVATDDAPQPTQMQKNFKSNEKEEEEKEQYKKADAAVAEQVISEVTTSTKRLKEKVAQTRAVSTNTVEQYRTDVVADTMWAQPVRGLLAQNLNDSANRLLSVHLTSVNSIEQEYALLLQGIYYQNTKQWALARMSFQQCIKMNGVHREEAKKLKRQLP